MTRDIDMLRHDHAIGVQERHFAEGGHAIRPPYALYIAQHPVKNDWRVLRAK